MQRWHRKLQLPVHSNGPHSPVFAYRAELDQWLHKYAQADEKTATPADGPGQVRSALVDKTRATVSTTLALLEQQNHALTSIAAQVQHLRKLQKPRPNNHRGAKRDHPDNQVEM